MTRMNPTEGVFSRRPISDDLARDREAIAFADARGGGPMIWRGRGGAVHRVAGGPTPESGSHAWLAWAACGVADLQPGEGERGDPAAVTCPRCRILGGEKRVHFQARPPGLH